MNDIMKMIRFDLITVSRLTVPYVAIFVVVSIIASLFGLPIGILCVVSFIMIIAPVQGINNSSCKKLYGMLPVRRSAVIKALFTEIIVTMFAGELLTFLCLLLVRHSSLYKILPEKLSEIARKLPEMPDSRYEKLYLLAAAAFAFITIILSFAQMRSEVKNMETAIRELIIIIAVFAAAATFISVMIYNEKLHALKDIIVPPTSAGKWLSIAILNAVTLAAAYLFCAFTVKKASDKEL
ncbi:hypothetical protein [uncultured Ruminococcus sp.]|uniref:hypothetical protein n=1 Tax=uncultured Ruminococcus sp. TaxID=165186 RepID=UPI0025E819E0|nr:hypothetical protein [uncultured Ruminococcus sp.]